MSHAGLELTRLLGNPGSPISTSLELTSQEGITMPGFVQATKPRASRMLGKDSAELHPQVQSPDSGKR